MHRAHKARCISADESSVRAELSSHICGRKGRTLYSHILIALNRSAVAHRALQQAIRLAAAFHATLTAVAVSPSLPFYAEYAAALNPGTRRILESDQQTSSSELLKMARMEGRQHDVAIETILTSGSIIGSLMEVVKINHIDLLVMGIHPDHELPEWLSNSLAHELAEELPCDVLGVH